MAADTLTFTVAECHAELRRWTNNLRRAEKEASLDACRMCWRELDRWLDRMLDAMLDDPI